MSTDKIVMACSSTGLSNESIKPPTRAGNSLVS